MQAVGVGIRRLLEISREHRTGEVAQLLLELRQLQLGFIGQEAGGGDCPSDLVIEPGRPSLEGRPGRSVKASARLKAYIIKSISP
jgi:hypothetical protein